MKKLISFLLVLTLCVLTLASCGTCTEHKDKDENGICDRCDVNIPITFFDAITTTHHDKMVLSVSSSVTFDVVGEPCGNNLSFGPLGSTDELTVTKKTVTKDVPAELNGGAPTTTEVTEYRVYRMKDGKLLYEKTVEEDKDFTSDTSTVGLTLILNGYKSSGWEIPEDRFIAVTVEKNKTVKVGVYDLQGSVLALQEIEYTGASSNLFNLVKFYNDKYFSVDGILYRAENGTAAEVCDIDLLGLTERLAGYTVYEIGDKYFALNNSNSYLANYGSYIAFDKSFNVIDYYDIPTYSGYTASFAMLSNGNLLVTYRQSKSVRDLTEGETYDYLIGSTAYNNDFYIYDCASGELRAIDDLPFHTFSVVSVKQMNDGFDLNGYNVEFTSFDQNFILGAYIEDGKVITNENRLYVMNNDGALAQQIVGLEDVATYDMSIIYLCPQDVFIFELPYGNYLYSRDGERIGMLPSGSLDVTYNAKWILFENTLYDFGLKETYKIDFNKYTLVRFANDVVYLSRHFEKDDAVADSKAYTQYYAYDGSDTLRELYKIEDGDLTKSIYFADAYYYTVSTVMAEGANPTVTYTVYSSAGVSVLSISRANTENVTYTLTLDANDENLVIIEKTVTAGAEIVTSYKYHVAGGIPEITLTTPLS